MGDLGGFVYSANPCIRHTADATGRRRRRRSYHIRQIQTLKSRPGKTDFASLGFENYSSTPWIPNHPRRPCLPSKHDTLKHCWFIVGPSSSTLAQHETNSVSMGLKKTRTRLSTRTTSICPRQQHRLSRMRICLSTTH